MSISLFKKMLVGAAVLTILQPGESIAQETQPLSPAEMRRNDDASVDRNIMSPSAETIRKGDVTFNSYELVLAGLTFGVTDNLQLSATTLLPIVEDIPLVLLFNGKWRLIHSDRLILSLVPSGSIVHKNDVTAGTIGVGIALDVLLDSQGKFVLSFAENNLWAYGGSDDEDVDFLDGVLFSLSGGFNFRIHKNLKLLAEISLPGGYVADNFEMVEEGLIFGYGVRFFGSTIAVDLTFLLPMHPDVDTPFIMGWPFVAFAARF